MKAATITVIDGTTIRGDGDQVESRATMQPFTVVSGPAVPLMRANVDTDIIIRIERMTSLGRHELGPIAMEALRYRADGSEDPDSVLNQPQFRNAPILLAGANFGCGSSREAAVWALMALGIRCVVAPSFGDIFFGNCVQNGVLPVVLDERALEGLARSAHAGRHVTVDLVQQHILVDADTPLAFSIDTLRREQLLAGLDAIDLALQDGPAILAWQDADRLRRPWIWNSVRAQ